MPSIRTMPLVFALLPVVSLSASARADVDASVSTSRGRQNVEYRFTDDPLAAGGIDPRDSRIVISKHLIRTTLIRPRTQFVLEMLKSVEQL
jgi:hypothetical protein